VSAGAVLVERAHLHAAVERRLLPDRGDRQRGAVALELGLGGEELLLGLPDGAGDEGTDRGVAELGDRAAYGGG
jgi:hypothetical protein